MHSSIFTYNITRPYPYRWFTPMVVVGGIIATTLFSLLNFASNGYYLSTEAVTDPNITLAHNNWMKKWPSYFASQVEASCQPLDIQVNNQFFTNHTGLTYTLKTVWQQSEDETANITSSITYLNNELRDCSINTIQIDYEAEDRTAAQYSWRRWGENVIAFITCRVETESGIFYLNLTSEYNLVSPTAGFPDAAAGNLLSFLNINNQTKASLWWGQSLLSMYWAACSLQLENEQKNNSDVDPRKGTVYLTRDNPNTKDIMDLSFFDVDYRFLSHDTPAEGNGAMLQNFSPEQADVSAHSISTLDHFNVYPNIWLNTDSLGKSMYSAVMTDLGQNQQPNILLNTTALQYYSANLSVITNPDINVYVGPALNSFSALQSQTGPLGTSPAVIFTKYLCQVPKRKSIGSLFISILIADLVFLQALWKLVNLMVENVLTRKDTKAKYCEGCLEQRKFGGDVHLLNETLVSDDKRGSIALRTRKAPISYVEIQQEPPI